MFTRYAFTESISAALWNPPMSTADACHWMLRFKVLQGDITREKVDAIVNAANTSLLGGGGLDGAIHRAAGPELLQECQTLGGCVTGEARITRGYRLPARHVLHAVGPVWEGGNHNEGELLASCYRSCFALLREHGLRSVAFPAISCGVYRFPLDRAAAIAVREIRRFLDANTEMERVHVVCFSREVYDAYHDVLQEMVPE
jgi:O-acetyl-ADP-ribose deacetylase (regulator of RNase III)